MPRLDNSSEEVISAFRITPGDDPPPIDLCLSCYVEWEGKGLDINHPDYEELTFYHCYSCGIMLGTIDNEERIGGCIETQAI